MRNSPTSRIAILVIASAALMLPSTSPAPASSATTTDAARTTRAVLPNFDHVFVLVMENKEYGQIIGSGQAPYINKLAKTSGLATRFYGITHPSLPNYLALIGGSTFGKTTDCTSCQAKGKNLVDQLEKAGISWKAYMGGMPHACYRGGYYGRYGKKHDPFMYFPDISGNAKRCHRVQPESALMTDLNKDRLPQFSFFSPDMCQNMHDCSIKSGDHYLSKIVPKILAHLGTNGVLFLTFDEGVTSAGCCSKAHGGHIATIVAGPGVPAASKRSVGYDLYSILRTVEDAWGLPYLRNAGCACTKSMTALF